MEELVVLVVFSRLPALLSLADDSLDMPKPLPTPEPIILLLALLLYVFND